MCTYISQRSTQRDMSDIRHIFCLKDIFHRNTLQTVVILCYLGLKRNLTLGFIHTYKTTNNLHAILLNHGRGKRTKIL